VADGTAVGEHEPQQLFSSLNQSPLAAPRHQRRLPSPGTHPARRDDQQR
jgi:hypothetical protein